MRALGNILYDVCKLDTTLETESVIKQRCASLALELNELIDAKIDAALENKLAGIEDEEDENEAE